MRFSYFLLGVVCNAICCLRFMLKPNSEWPASLQGEQPASLQGVSAFRSDRAIPGRSHQDLHCMLSSYTSTSWWENFISSYDSPLTYLNRKIISVTLSVKWTEKESGCNKNDRAVSQMRFQSRKHTQPLCPFPWFSRAVVIPSVLPPQVERTNFKNESVQPTLSLGTTTVAGWPPPKSPRGVRLTPARSTVAGRIAVPPTKDVHGLVPETCGDVILLGKGTCRCD